MTWLGLVFLFILLNLSYQNVVEYHCHWLCPNLLEGKLQVQSHDYWVEWCQKGCKNDEAMNHPIILTWTKFFGDKSMLFYIGYENTLPDCPYQCLYTDDRRFEDYASAIVFHSRGIRFWDLPTRRDDVFMVFNTKEPPGLSTKYFWQSLSLLPEGYFNATMTYRMDSDAYCPYNGLELMSSTSAGHNVLQYVHNKTQPLVHFVSNCNTDSDREDYVEELQKHISISQFGSCNNRECDYWCLMDEIDKAYFVIAFENSVCDDYVTEKFWRFKDLVVPIVLSRKIAEKAIPKDEKIFIAADDFSNPKELAEYLKFLMANPDEYIKYFTWTKKYKLSFGTHTLCWCNLCKFLHTHKHKRIDDLEKWWKDDANCKDGYAKTLL